MVTVKATEHINSHDDHTHQALSVIMFLCVCVCVCAAFQTEGKLYLILDFLRGGDLFTRLSKEVGLLLLNSLARSSSPPRKDYITRSITG